MHWMSKLEQPRRNAEPGMPSDLRSDSVLRSQLRRTAYSF